MIFNDLIAVVAAVFLAFYRLYYFCLFMPEGI